MAPSTLARMDFNLFLRNATCAILFLLSVLAPGIAAELIGTERAKDTWNSLIATPLSPREILLSKLRASLWRLRTIGIILVSLWASVCSRVQFIRSVSSRPF